MAPRTPTVPVQISLFIDGHPAGTERCTRHHDHLTRTGFPAQTGGFAYSITDRFLDGATHTLSILFEDGSTLFFRGETETLQAKIAFTAEPVTSVEGVVDGLHGDLIEGWAPRRHHRNDDFEGHLRLQVLCNGFVIEEILADHPHVDVARQHRCDPRVGFACKLPPQCTTGLEFEFSFRTLPEQELLQGCPLAVKYRSTENADDLKVLAETVEELCARAFTCSATCVA